VHAEAEKHQDSRASTSWIDLELYPCSRTWNQQCDAKKIEEISVGLTPGDSLAISELLCCC
jgi:hypothetical protein